MHHEPSSMILLIQDCREAEMIYWKKNAEMVEIDSSGGKGLLEEMKQLDSPTWWSEV